MGGKTACHRESMTEEFLCVWMRRRLQNLGDWTAFDECAAPHDPDAVGDALYHG